MDNAIGDGKASALGNNGHRHWTAFSVPSGDDPLQAFQTVAKQQPPTALLEPVELDELHPIQSQNDVSPAGNENDQRATGEGDQRPPQGTRKSNNSEVLLTVAPGTTSASSSTDGGKQQEMKNGKLLTTVYPKNVPFFWIRRPTFDGVEMPPVLANPQNRLTPDAYSNIVRTVEKDSRFVSYAMFYSRMIPVWLVFSIVILLAVLASSPMGGLPVMVFAFVWLFMLITGLLFCALLQKFIVLALRNLVKEVNTISQTYRILVGVQDRGLIFVFYDFDGCREDVARQLRVQQANYGPSGANNSLSDMENSDKAEGLMLDYAQAYIKGLVKLRLRFPTRPSEGVSDFLPRHVAKSHCLCQFVATEHFHKGPQKRLAPCLSP
uniref:Transmembrane protein n=1 Tax=Globodera rostochiensis TaxID=31243 RepID=A0A914HSI5_GLORO